MYASIAFGATFVVAILVAMLAEHRDRRAMAARRSRLLARPTYDQESWFQRNYSAIGIERQLVVEVLSRLAATLRCDMTQLLPADSFIDELGLKNVWPIQLDPDDELNYFADVELPALLGRPVDPEDFLAITRSRTIEDLLRRVDAVRSREPAPIRFGQGSV